MVQFSIVAAIDEAGGLGYKNQLLCHLPADLKHFKEVTMGKPIIMGSHTFASIGRPLPGRLNIVVSSSLQQQEGIQVVRSLEEAFECVSDIPEAMIIGGQRIFEQTISRTSKLYLTIIHHTFKADVYFPKIDPSTWICENQVFCEKDEQNPFDYTFIEYSQKS